MNNFFLDLFFSGLLPTVIVFFIWNLIKDKEAKNRWIYTIMFSLLLLFILSINLELSTYFLKVALFIVLTSYLLVILLKIVFPPSNVIPKDNKGDKNKKNNQDEKESYNIIELIKKNIFETVEELEKKFKKKKKKE